MNGLLGRLRLWQKLAIFGMPGMALPPLVLYMRTSNVGCIAVTGMVIDSVSDVITLSLGSNQAGTVQLIPDGAWRNNRARDFARKRMIL